MNKLAVKSRQTRLIQQEKKGKKATRKVCRCSPAQSSKKNSQSKVIVTNQSKIKKVIKNIRSMCGEGCMQNSSREPNSKSSDQSVIYVGTYSKQSCPIIDLTNSNTSLDDSGEAYYRNCNGNKQVKTLYLSNFRNGGRLKYYLPRPTKPTSLVNLPAAKSRIVGRNCLQLSNSAVSLYGCRTDAYKKIEALDLPHQYQDVDMFRDYDAGRRIKLDDEDHKTMDMVLDLEDEYQLLFKGDFQPDKRFESNSDLNQLVNTYYVGEH